MEEIAVAREAFKRFCLQYGEDERFEDLNWYDMSVGFFMALGLTPDEARELANECRYTNQYWLRT